MKKKSIFIFTFIGAFMVSVIPISYFIYSQSERRYYDDLIKETNVNYLNFENLEYLFTYTSGFEDQVGMYYFVFAFDEQPNEFLNQFSNYSFDNKFIFFDLTNQAFEVDIISKIQLHVGDQYGKVPDAYKLDFTNPYKYSNFPMVYFPNSKRLIIIQFIWVL